MDLYPGLDFTGVPAPRELADRAGLSADSLRKHPNIPAASWAGRIPEVPCGAQQLQQAPNATGGVLGGPEFRYPL